MSRPAKKGGHVKCATGALCNAPAHANLSESTHFCFECGQKMHCAMWCGKVMSEIALDKIISADMFSIAGRLKFQSSDHDSIYICKVCIKRLALDNNDPPTIAPALPIVLPFGAVSPAMNPTTGFLFPSALIHLAASASN